MRYKIQPWANATRQYKKTKDSTWILPTHYTQSEGGAWTKWASKLYITLEELEFHLKYAKSYGKKSVKIKNCLVHSIKLAPLANNQVNRWNCINGWIVDLDDKRVISKQTKCLLQEPVLAIDTAPLREDKAARGSEAVKGIYLLLSIEEALFLKEFLPEFSTNCLSIREDKVKRQAKYRDDILTAITNSGLKELQD